MQQFTGINVVMYYAPRIFKEMGYDTHAQMIFTAVVGLTNMLATLIALAFVDRLGRKPILYAGFAMMTVGLGAVGTMMALGIASRGEQLFTVGMLLFFIVGFAMSAGPLIWTLCAEVQPLKGRDFGIACSTFTNWITNMLVGATFLSLLSGIGNAQTFWLYAGLNAVFIVLTFWLVPETKNVTLEQIERNLMSGKALRKIGQ
jgi:SP family galactose:H+ symporter-like MFS transporter